MESIPGHTESVNSVLCIVICLILSHFSMGLVFALQAPFFPGEAEEKGLHAYQYGFVFSVYSGMVIIISALFSEVLKILGMKPSFCYGILLLGISTTLFGLLTFLRDPSLFLTSALILRIIEGTGMQLSELATLVMVPCLFGDTRSSKLSMIKASVRAGYVLGPGVGGVLFSLGGFITPFLVVGCILLVNTIVLWKFLPSISTSGSKELSLLNTWKLLKIPGVWLNLYGAFASSFGEAFVALLLEPHLSQFQLPSELLGAVFMISPIMYIASIPIVGKLQDNLVGAETFFLLGAATLILALSVIGPLPVFPFEPSLALVVIGLVMHGMGVSFCYMGSMGVLINQSIESSGQPEDVAVGLMTSLWQFWRALAFLLAPGLGGIFIDNIGFRWAIFISAFLNVVFFVLTVCRKCYTNIRKRTYESMNEKDTG